MKTRLLVLLILIVSSGCSVAEEIDKFSLWENPSYFRGAAVHPYVPYGEEEGRIYTTEEDFIALREQGANVVSLNYPGPFTVESPYRLDPEALQYLDNAIDWAGMGEGLIYEYPGRIPSDLFSKIRYWDREVIEEVFQPVKDFQERYGVPIFIGGRD